MIWAIKDSKRIKSSPKLKASCPICGEEVLAKCGSIKIWHWAHKSNFECDKWGEHETEWHINWKNEFPREQQEIIIKKCISDYCNNKKYNHNHIDEYNHGDCVDCEFIKHIADIKTKYLVIELQNSIISPEEIIEKELFYGNMIWVLNGDKFGNGLCLRRKGEIFTFRWKHPPKSWWNATKPLFIDFCDGKTMFELKKVYNSIPCGGWGRLLSKQEFLKRFKDD